MSFGLEARDTEGKKLTSTAAEGCECLGTLTLTCLEAQFGPARGAASFQHITFQGGQWFPGVYCENDLFSWLPTGTDGIWRWIPCKTSCRTAQECLKSQFWTDCDTMGGNTHTPGGGHPCQAHELPVGLGWEESEGSHTGSSGLLHVRFRQFHYLPPRSCIRH